MIFFMVADSFRSNGLKLNHKKKYKVKFQQFFLPCDQGKIYLMLANYPCSFIFAHLSINIKNFKIKRFHG